MSKTISFRASEELDEFLEEEAERRLTTKSTVAQMLLAERVRQMKGAEEVEMSPGVEGDASSRSGDTKDGLETSDPEEVLDEFDDHWYESTGATDYAIETPNGDKRYIDDASEAARVLLSYYD